MTPRLKERYKTEIVPQLEKDLEIKNINQVPKLVKIVVNMGVGGAASDSKLLDGAIADLRAITGQQPMVCRAKKSIAGFHISLGITEQLIFPEIDYDKVDRTRGMDITVVTTAEDDEQGYALLKALGFPFKERK